MLPLADIVMNARLSNADQALENLQNYKTAYATEEPAITNLEQQVARLPAVVSAKVEEAQRDVELTMVTLDLSGFSRIFVDIECVWCVTYLQGYQ
jgi:hypothetical protein